MKIPQEYGGLGLTVSEYCRVMQTIGSYDANILRAALGAPVDRRPAAAEALRHARAEDQVSAALRGRRDLRFRADRSDVGSDPSSLATTAERDGDVLRPERREAVVHQRHAGRAAGRDGARPETKRISAFVVETGWRGVTVEHRCRSWGSGRWLTACSLPQRRVPRENLVGREGDGLKIALTTLNTGRLTIPAGATGLVKQCLAIVRDWSQARVQWGVPIWKHEVISHQIAEMAATAFAMDSVFTVASQLADRGGYDIRLEAAAAKEWNTARQWDLVDRTLQIRGGRGFETEASLSARAESRRRRRAHAARLPHQSHLRGLERDHAPVHGARGVGQAPAASRARSSTLAARSARGSPRSRASPRSTGRGIRRSGSRDC